MAGCMAALNSPLSPRCPCASPSVSLSAAVTVLGSPLSRSPLQCASDAPSPSTAATDSSTSASRASPSRVAWRRALCVFSLKISQAHTRTCMPTCSGVCGCVRRLQGSGHWLAGVNIPLRVHSQNRYTPGGILHTAAAVAHRPRWRVCTCKQVCCSTKEATDSA